MSRPDAPNLDQPAPPCPLCGEETTDYGYDEWKCDYCDASWEQDTGEFAEWGDPKAEQCPSTTYNTWTRRTHRCLRAADHPGSLHADGLVAPWSSETAVATPEQGTTP